MDNIIRQMLGQYDDLNLNEKENRIKEIVQEIILCGLSRAGFFQTAAFYGGTALRIFHGLDRFSEDLDFSLAAPDAGFQLEKYLPAVEKELMTYGFRFSLETKMKKDRSDIQSAFVKGNTREHILLCYADETLARSVAGSRMIKVKFEVDTTPPPYAGFEHRYRLVPVPYEIMLYDMPSLFAGKIHAVLCRAWQSRIKGRDLYDYVFYLSRSTPVNLRHLNARLMDSGFEGAREDMTLEEIKEILCRRFEVLDYENAKADVHPFISSDAPLAVWSSEFYRSITGDLTEQTRNDRAHER